jgi:hypothetical protein
MLDVKGWCGTGESVRLAVYSRTTSLLGKPDHYR